ncbi:MAG: 2-amino-4-hydroxy-6-hydroxymethyldihydropteridine diphosphokinase [Candidatus Omnitrophica bacterium]|nr:2-amino-4-hydroxy-6-hydroxymethyldihydropteridine diphosphokinase [Candidatus Omnitrophota bacterium]
MVTAYIAFGSNLGDRNKNIEKAIEYLKELTGVTVQKVSSVYETDPVGGPVQGKFLNGALEIETALLPDELLDRLKGIESRLGRTPQEENSPRPIDLDIIFYGDVVISGGRIKIPHPRMHEREFVLKGLIEIAPDFMHPRLNKTVRQLYDELKGINEGNNSARPDAAVQQSPEAAG